MTNRALTLALLAPLLFVGAADAASVQLQITTSTEVTGLTGKTTLNITNYGDAVAISLKPTLEMGGSRVRFPEQGRLGPGETYVGSVTVGLPAGFRGTRHGGVYVSYRHTDGAGQTVAALTAFNRGQPTRFELRLKLDDVQLTGELSSGKLVVANRGREHRRINIRAVVPPKVRIEELPQQAEVAIGESIELPFRVRKVGVPGSGTLPMHLIIEYASDDGYSSQAVSADIYMAPRRSILEALFLDRRNVGVALVPLLLVFGGAVTFGIIEQRRAKKTRVS